MKRISHFFAKLTVLALMLAAGGQAAAQELADGYYYIGLIERPGTFLMDNFDAPAAAHAWRIRDVEYNAPAVPTVYDKPYIFKVSRTDGGRYTIMNINRNLYCTLLTGHANGAGGGLGQGGEATAFTIEHESTKDGFTVRDLDSNMWFMSWGDGYASFCPDNMKSNARMSRLVWNFVKVDDALVAGIRETKVTNKPLADGYYLINLPFEADGLAYLRADLHDVDMSYRPVLDLLDGKDYDDSFIFHITRLPNGNYRMKNCGAQNETYIFPYTFTGAPATAMFMTGYKDGEMRIELLDNGTAYIYPAGQNVNFVANVGANMLETGNVKNGFAMWRFVPVKKRRVSPRLKVQEAVTDALGGNYEAGDDFDQVPRAAYDKFMAVIDAARGDARARNVEKNIAKVRAAAAEVEKQRVPFNGQYRFVNAANGRLLYPLLRKNKGDERWWLSHEKRVKCNTAAVWSVRPAAAGKYAIEHVGAPELKYIMATNPGNGWSQAYLGNVLPSKITFRRFAAGRYLFFLDGNIAPLNSGGDNYITCNAQYYPDSFWRVEPVRRAQARRPARRPRSQLAAKPPLRRESSSAATLKTLTARRPRSQRAAKPPLLCESSSAATLKTLTARRPRSQRAAKPPLHCESSYAATLKTLTARRSRSRRAAKPPLRCESSPVATLKN